MGGPVSRIRRCRGGRLSASDSSWRVISPTNSGTHHGLHLGSLQGYSFQPLAEDQLRLEDRWMLSRLATVTRQVTSALEVYRFAEAARGLYDFAWDEFCSFYIEMLKDRLRDPAERPVAQQVLAFGLDRLLRLLHPMIPFITEEVWQMLDHAAPVRGITSPESRSDVLMLASWPGPLDRYVDESIEAQFAQFQRTLGAVREYPQPPGDRAAHGRVVPRSLRE